MSNGGRHLAIPFLLEHIAAGLTTIYPFPGEPAVDLLIEGAVPRLTLRAAQDRAARVPANLLKNVRVRAENVAGTPRVSVAIDGDTLMLDGHAMLCAIADRIQLDGLEPMRAVADTLRQWREVLAARGRLSSDAEVGLVGELLVLEALYAVTGSAALTSWRGAMHEEHDFGLTQLDVEVKTTSTERRQHWITSLTQLQPTTGRDLALVSLQITRGGNSGRSLPSIIEAVRAAVDSAEFDQKLAQVGWDDATSDLFFDRWLPRSAAALFMVNETFPAITPQVIRSDTADMSAVTDVRYRVDLTRRGADRVPDGNLEAALALLASARERA